MTLHQVPVAVRVGVRRYTFEHDGGRTVAQWTIHDVRVASDPPAVRYRTVDVAISQIKRIFRSQSSVE